MKVLDQLNNVALLYFLRNVSEIDTIEASTYDWETLIRQARHANLISRIAILLKQSGIFEAIPNQPRQHFLNAIKISKAHERSARWEVEDIYSVLSQQKIDFMLLKGCAYIWQKNNASIGRLFGDTDILVRKSDIKAAEKVLVHSGWVTTKLDPYDQRYYRDWMHEIPPLHHTSRHSTLDVHHSIIPPIVLPDFKAEHLWENPVEHSNQPGLYTLNLADMILHSATHLFLEGELDNGLRDLIDLDALLRQYQDSNEDWEALILRAKTLGLSNFLFDAILYCNKILSTPVPGQYAATGKKRNFPHRLKRWFMDQIYIRALSPSHTSCRVSGQKLASLFIFIRAHWIKMPLYILLPHIFKKYQSQIQKKPL